ncbi:MAG: xanthine dehydrogenase family protein subunit M [Acetobacteraceae bacterium]|nr:xanthine dehydrogenase family protein subunit M [Acetobacteraceae bacterium]
MRQFQYATARSVQAAHDLGSAGAAMFIAGGTDMLQLLQEDVLAPDTLVDISHLPYSGLRADEDGARIGALARLADVADDQNIQRLYPMLALALKETASPQVRNMATVGGNLLQRTRCLYFRDRAVPCNKRAPGSGCPAQTGQNRMNAILGGSEACIAAYPGDMAVALVALNASIEIRGRSGLRFLKVENLHRLPGNTPHIETDLQPGEIIAAIRLPRSPVAAHSHFLKVRDRASFEWALVSVAVGLEIQDGKVQRASVVAGSVGTKPWRLHPVEARLAGKTLDLPCVKDASSAAGEGAQPRAGNAFKVALLEHAVERAVLTAGGLA